jgi:hypothetical protein
MQGRKGTTDALLLDKAFPNLATQTKYQKNQTGGMRRAFFSLFELYNFGYSTRWKSPKLSMLRKKIWISSNEMEQLSLRILGQRFP